MGQRPEFKYKEPEYHHHAILLLINRYPGTNLGQRVAVFQFLCDSFANKSRQFARIAALNVVKMDVNLTGKTTT